MTLSAQLSVSVVLFDGTCEDNSLGQCVGVNIFATMLFGAAKFYPVSNTTATALRQILPTSFS